MNQLPSLPGRAPFPTNPPDDNFRLPVEKASGTCSLSVYLTHGASVLEASWPEIKAKAGQLNQVCIPPTNGPSDSVRGATYERDDIIIWLAYGHPRVDRGNGTLDESLS